MPTNPYVNWWTDTNEQALLQSLMTEAIQMYGIDIVYLPRTLRKEDVFYNEDVLSQFTSHFPLEMYLKNVMGWEGQGNFLNKFGLQIEHTLTVMVSVERFREIVPLTRPLEGDWIYLPAPINKLFEIKFVENEKAAGQFYPLGTRTFYELQLELYTYTHEQIRTGHDAVDDYERDLSYAIDLVVGAGSGTFTIGETVYQGNDLLSATATGNVAEWTPDTSTLRVIAVTGSFANGVVVRGASAAYTVGTTPDILANPTDPMDDNRYLRNQSDDFIDTSERNPFQG